MVRGRESKLATPQDRLLSLHNFLLHGTDRLRSWDDVRGVDNASLAGDRAGVGHGDLCTPRRARELHAVLDDGRVHRQANYGRTLHLPHDPHFLLL